MKRQFYNQDRKEAFITTSGAPGKTVGKIEVAFSRLAEIEREKGMDVCEFQVSDIADALPSISSSSYASMTSTIRVIKDYATWCKTKGISNVNTELCEIKPASIGGCLEETDQGYVSCPAHLQRVLESVFDPEDDQTMDLVYRGVFWLSYSGVSEDDIYSVRTGDVDLERSRIRVGKYNLPIYPESKRVFQNLIMLNAFLSRHPGYPDKIMKRVDGDILLRGLKANASIITTRGILSHTFAAARKSGKTASKLSISRAWTSGVFYRLYEMEKNGDELHVAPLAPSLMENCKKLTPEEFTTAEKNIIRNYRYWKKTFGL